MKSLTVLILAVVCGAVFASSCPESNGQEWACTPCYTANLAQCLNSQCSFCTTPFSPNVTDCLSTLPPLATGWACVQTSNCILYATKICNYKGGLSGMEIFWIVVLCLLILFVIFAAIAAFVKKMKMRRAYESIASSAPHNHH
eukprot:TRINITY_DN255_c0_g1_i1.p1 TRINITY_DN255_c0_g1~~TRINITY_DN255_c0_g1_i1.p1  ORF type:complete len:143 (-),score=47.79 TRINITY_DN255_c0_g1_i1:26-454(-)